MRIKLANYVVMAAIAASLGATEQSKPTLKKSFRAQQIKTAANLKVVIIGPETVAPGTLVKLDASQSDGDTFSWKLAGVNSESYEVSDDGKKVYFANTTPGRYAFVFAVAKKNADGAPLLVLTEHVLTVQGSVSPTKPDNPAPPVTPTDSLPQGRFGLARFTRDLVNSSLTADKRGLSPQLAANYSLVAAQLRGGTLSGKNTALAKLTEKNRATVGNQTETWKPVIVAIGKKLQDMEVAKVHDPANNSDLATIFEEISLGLAAVGN